MRRWAMALTLGLGLGTAGFAAPAMAAPQTPVALPPPSSLNIPPPPGKGYCTEAVPCRSALNEWFAYTPSGDRRYLNRR